MTSRTCTAAILAAALAAGCAREPVSKPPEPEPRARVSPEPRAETPVRPATLDGYKRTVADRIVRTSTETFQGPIPPMLKSVVVLDVSIGQDGRPRRVSVRRSNGYSRLERQAVESVWRAAPFAPPASHLLRGANSLNFLETFLFADDGRFQIRSLVD